MSNLDVMVIGGGIGGLCLAQGLKKAGVKVTVYERDEASTSRPQGFRVHIDPQGSTALHQCLPHDLWTIFDATGGHFSQGFALMSEQLQELLTFRSDGEVPAGAVARHRSVSRITLRHILLAGLEDVVQFNKRFAGYEEKSDGTMVAYFEDGSTAQGNLLIAADGVNSQVRKQYLPHAEPIDTGVVTVGGRISLTDGVMALLPPRLLDGPALVLAPEACSLFMAVWKREARGNGYLHKLGLENGIPEDDDYVVLGFGGRREFFGFGSEPATMSGGELKNVLRRKVTRWHPAVRKLVELLDESQITTGRIRTSEPVPEWKTTRTTLLGDAIHSMTPYRGIGANIALKDAALLCAKLTEAARGEKPVLEAIAEYETAMREYGFAAVAASLKSMEQATGEKSFGFGLAKTAMRVVNAVPALRRRMVPA
jgi:2-polyprenyl-6-methoxyphenol hydroxylase-like FAD-dependent oxidoreductase